MSTKALQEQFTTIYQAQSDAIFRFCVLRVSDREQALDLVQETFARLWQSLTKGQKIDNARGFLFTVAQRLVIDWYRKKKAVPFNRLESEEEDAAFDPPDTTLEGLGLGAEGRYLLGKIGEIGPSNRQAVYLRFVEGLSPGEIGDILGVSANAASVRINRGLAELRKIAGYDISPS